MLGLALDTMQRKLRNQNTDPRRRRIHEIEFGP